MFNKTQQHMLNCQEEASTCQKNALLTSDELLRLGDSCPVQKTSKTTCKRAPERWRAPPSFSVGSRCSAEWQFMSMKYILLEGKVSLTALSACPAFPAWALHSSRVWDDFLHCSKKCTNHNSGTKCWFKLMLIYIFTVLLCWKIGLCATRLLYFNCPIKVVCVLQFSPPKKHEFLLFHHFTIDTQHLLVTHGNSAPCFK